MKPILSTLRPGRDATSSSAGDDTVGRGMDMALTLALFIVLGAVLDNWLGTFPVFTISFIIVGAVGSFLRMKYVYDAAMDRHEEERRANLHAVGRSDNDTGSA